MGSTEPVGLNKTWELSLYELHRTPQEAITDNTEIAVSPRSLHSELMCPICLELLNKTMTTKECLHRFCSDCIITALRSGNKECPTCRKKLVSKRSLRPDPNFDLLISKIYPSRDEYEAHQVRVLEKLNKSHSQAALVSSITEGIKLQAQNRLPRSKKSANDTDLNVSTNSETGAAAAAATAAAISAQGETSSDSVTPSNQPLLQPHTSGASVSSAASTASAASSVSGSSLSSASTMSKEQGSKGMKKAKSVANSEADSVDSSIDTSSQDSSEGSDEPLNMNEIELVFKPHPAEMVGDERFLKTTSNATVDHLSKYLAMRLTLDLGSELPNRTLNFCIYISPSSNQLVVLDGKQTLRQVKEKHWKANKPLEMFYSWKKT